MILQPSTSVSSVFSVPSGESIALVYEHRGRDFHKMLIRTRQHALYYPALFVIMIRIAGLIVFSFYTGIVDAGKQRSLAAVSPLQ